MGEKLKISHYATRAGVSNAAVHHAIKSGRLAKSVTTDAKGRRWVDVEIADREWGLNTDDDKRRNEGAGGRPAAGAPKGQNEMFPGANRNPGTGGATAGGKTLSEWRALQMAIQTKNEQLDLDERQRRLADVGKIKAEWFKLVRGARDRLLIIADRIDGQLAAETEQKKVHSILDREIREALLELANDGRPAA